MKRFIFIFSTLCLLFAFLLGGFLFYIRKTPLQGEYAPLTVDKVYRSGGYTYQLDFDNEQKEADYDYSEIPAFTYSDYAKYRFEALYNPPKQAFELSIPSVNTYLPVYFGVAGSHLWLGACTYSPTALPGENNNFILMAHNTPYKNVLFSSLKYIDLSVPNFAYIYRDGITYTYLLTEKETIYYTDTRYLEPSDDAILTLITCEGGEATPYRTVVRGELYDVEIDPYLTT